MRLMTRSVSLLALLSALAVGVHAQQTRGASVAAPPARHTSDHVLDRIRAAQALSCGVTKEEEDYSRAEDHGNRAAFDIDLCKAIAVATLGPGAHLVVKSFPDEPASVKALLAGEIDVLATASPTVANTARGLVFTAPVLYDGQGFLFPNNPAIQTPRELAGKRICYLTGSLAETGLHSYAAAHKISYIFYPFSEAGEMEAAFFTGNCDAISSDVTQLANIRGIEAHRAQAFTMLPQLIRQDPLAVATWGGDVRFAAIVHWTVEALIEAEALSVTAANARSLTADPRPEVQQLLGQRYGTGTALGLNPRWGAEVIEAVGNYGEMFARDLGAGSPLRLDRGENRLWSDGGLLFAEPLADR